MTLAGSILNCLSDNWELTGDGAKEKLHFSEKDWFDTSVPNKSQVSVSLLVERIGKFLSNEGGTLTLHSYPQFLVNCWVPIPRGAKGTAEAQLIEDMRYEVTRIITANRNSIADFSPIVPMDQGTPLHEVNKEPRVLRYEITLMGAHDKES